MRLPIFCRLIGMLLILFAIALVVPLLISLTFADGVYFAFLGAIIASFLAGTMMAAYGSIRDEALHTRDGIIVTIGSWLAVILFGSLPLVFSGYYNFIDAWFDSMSGLTTTGASVVANVEDLPISLLFYRQFLQWLGGMGLILFVVAVLPLLGTGGMQLYRTEIPGPVKDQKFTPRIKETAKLLWSIYISLTIACIISYKLAGMDWFDAISYSFSTVSIGGFAPHNDNFGHFDSAAIHLVAIIFMLLSAMNFALHFYAWRLRSPLPYIRDPEWRFFILCILLVLLGMTSLWWRNMTDVSSTIAAVFQAVSIISTTGYTLENFNGFSVNILLMLFLVACVGCCAGSTGGGIKIVRFLLLIKQGYRECRRSVHQYGVFNVRLGDSIVPDRILESVWGFCSIYLMSFFVIMVLLIISGTDYVTAWSATVASINNLGPGLGAVSADYSSLATTQKLILSMAMLIGRLEVITFVVLLLPATWR